MTVAELMATLSEPDWIRHQVTEGAKGPREYQFARVRVVEKRHKRPGSWGWMMARRPVGCRNPKEFTYYLSNAPETVALAEMARVGCLRWTIEENLELAKGELGLDHYEVTKYRGWHHHITLVMLVLAFLKSVQLKWKKMASRHQFRKYASSWKSSCLGVSGRRPSRSPGGRTSSDARL